MKIISFYLPQFHEIPENNDAWGNGFTEWTNVKKCKPLFWGHYQPRIPLDNNYYSLLDPNTIRWQAELATAYGIDCFCFYHYWFNGRLVLEKPVEILRKMGDTHVYYCFAWANEPWTKTWHGAGGDREILIPQEYGREDEWEAHYQYFLTYFRDERYLKKKNCPVLLVYKLQNIPFYNDMIQYWKNRAKCDGFDGIFFLCMKQSKSRAYLSEYVDGTVDFEPNNTKAGKLSEQGTKMAPVDRGSILYNRMAIKTLDYREINNEMLHRVHKKNEFRTVFVDYDDTPRRGSRGVVTLGRSTKLFGQYLKKTLCLAQKEKNEYIFVNAWNEWGEGNYLEPDTRNGYSCLEAVKRARRQTSI